MRRITVLIRSTLAVCVLLVVNFVSAAESPAAATNASPGRTKDNVEFIIGRGYANAPELTV